MPRRNVIQLSRRHKAVLYTVTLALFASGAAWAWLHYFAKVEGEFGPEKHPWLPTLTKIHGAAAFAALISFGLILGAHVPAGYRTHRSRLSGFLLITVFSVSILTAYGLYYSGSDEWRPTIILTHLISGLSLPVLITAHIVAGRRRRAAAKVLPLPQR